MVRCKLYTYMHYHPTNDYPINLENVYKMIGFANKGNAMKTIKNNFTKNEDYKVTLLKVVFDNKYKYEYVNENTNA
uniref:Uncharacterized protein n=1 Tax=viral metagenome TaxID=1070528 RepID=A0A6C0H6D5_9ZZZZ